MKATLFTDGGARGNPGPAGIGYVITPKGKPPVTHGEYIGTATNNQAEYKALIDGLAHAKKLGVADLDCFLDSELVVKQIRGQYRVKNEDLKPLYQQVLALKESFSTISFAHIPRSKNAAADALVNKALDARK